MEFLLGMNAKAYFAEIGEGQEVADIPLANMTEMSNITDATLTLEASEADVTTRANQGWRATAQTLREATFEFDMIWKPTDAGFAAVKAAYLNSKPIAFCILTGDRDDDVATASGPRASWSITNFSRAEPLEEAIKVSVTAKMATFVEWIEPS